MNKWIGLAAGGLAGTFARYIVSGAVHRALGPTFPYGTLLVNTVGCFLIGVFAALAEEKFVLGPEARVLLMAGFCGAFTTFSTFILETANLMRTGAGASAFLNISVSLAAGFLAMRLGFIAAEFI